MYDVMTSLREQPRLKPRFQIGREEIDGVPLLHDDGTLRDYLRWIGFSTDIHDAAIQDIVRFYDVHFRGDLLFVVESGPNSQRNIRLAAEAACEFFENIAIEQGRIAPRRGYFELL